MFNFSVSPSSISFLGQILKKYPNTRHLVSDFILNKSLYWFYPPSLINFPLNSFNKRIQYIEDNLMIPKNIFFLIRKLGRNQQDFEHVDQESSKPEKSLKIPDNTLISWAQTWWHEPIVQANPGSSDQTIKFLAMLRTPLRGRLLAWQGDQPCDLLPSKYE